MEQNGDEYYDYNTDQPITTTTEKPLIQTSRNHYLSSKEILNDSSKISFKKSNTSRILQINKYLNNNSSVKNKTYTSQNKYNVSQDKEVNSNENITIEFHNKYNPASSFHPEYQVIREKGDEIRSSEENISFIQSSTPESSETTETLKNSLEGKQNLEKPIIQRSHGVMTHPCARECIKGEEPMTCYYKFNVEWYYSMSKACHNCSNNENDCSRTDCIPANGMKRAIIVVNRTLPGPSIEASF